MDSQTYGQRLVGVSFNPSGNERVDEIKRKTAELIDLMAKLQEVCNWHPSPVNDAPQANRCAALAITNYEQAAMWAVKAVTR